MHGVSRPICETIPVDCALHCSTVTAVGAPCRSVGAAAARASLCWTACALVFGVFSAGLGRMPFFVPVVAA